MIAGFVLRHMADERETFKEAVAEGKKEKAPLTAAVRGHGKTILPMIGAGSATAIASYSIQGYLLAYTTQQLGMPANTAVIAITIAAAVSVFGIPLGGWLSDRVGRRPLMIGGGIATALFALPFWLLVGTKSLPVISMAVSLAFAVILGIITAISVLLLRETAPRALHRRAIKSGASDGSTPIDVEYAEV